MRILIGPIDKEHPTYYGYIFKGFQSLPSGESEDYDVKSFAEKNADVTYRYDQVTFQDILNQLPDNWIPDVVFFWDPAYQGVPPGIEDSPYPTIGMICDWNLGFDAIGRIAGCFDFLFTDAGGVDILNRLGFENVEHYGLYGFDPDTHRRIGGVEKIYDITFVGNLNHEVQRERARWLKRIARLSDRYKVKIVSGVYGDEYAKILNQSKITFNRSIRGEMNMRAYEAPACGSLLFLEEENKEARDYFTDRVHCVLYNDQNLEELIEYYLNHDEERQEIARKGHEKVQEYSYSNQIKRIIERLKEIGLENIKKQNRQFLSLEAHQQHKNRAVQAFHSVITDGNLVVAKRELDNAQALIPEDPEILNNQGVVLATRAFSLKGEENRLKRFNEAESYLVKAIQQKPSYAIAHFNLANIYCCIGNNALAEEEFLAAVVHEVTTERSEHDALKGGEDETVAPLGLFFPTAYDTFRVQYESALLSRVTKETNDETIRKLISWRVWESLGEIYFGQQDYQKAEKAFQTALDFRPDIGKTKYKLAQALQSLGLNDEAIKELRQAVELEPFHLQMWMDLANLLSSVGRLEECAQFCQDCITVIEGYIPFQDAQSFFLNLRNRCEEQPKAEGVGSEQNMLGTEEAWQLDKGCVLIRKEVWKELGGFTPPFENNEFLADFARRCRQAGYKTVHLKDAKLFDAESTQLATDTITVENMSVSKDEEALRYLKIGDEWRAQGELERASAFYKKALEAEPDYLDALEAYAETLLLLDRPNEAIEPLKKAVDIDPNSPAKHNNLGKCFYQAGQKEKAKKQFQKAIKIAENDAEGYNNLGVLYWEDGNAQMAIDNFKKAIQIDKNDLDAVANLGIMCYQAEMFEDAIPLFEKYLAEKPDDVQMKTYLADAYEKKTASHQPEIAHDNIAKNLGIKPKIHKENRKPKSSVSEAKINVEMNFNDLEGITKRAAIDVGHICNLDCLFCYHRWEKPKSPFLSAEEIMARLKRYREEFNLTVCDFTGGEPMILPRLVEIVKYAADIGIPICIITNGQNASFDKLESLADAGVKEFLLSIQGTREIHDKLVSQEGAFDQILKLMGNLDKLQIPWRVNTVLTKWNAETLPALAEQLCSLRSPTTSSYGSLRSPTPSAYSKFPNSPENVNFICFNPWADWVDKTEIDLQGRHCDMAPYVKEAIDIYSAEGIWCNVRYVPFCIYKGYEKHITNFPQIIYDPLEWDARAYWNLSGETINEVYTLGLSNGVWGKTRGHIFFNTCMKHNQAKVAVKSEECMKCRNFLICDGLHHQYAERYGWSEISPLEGELIYDPEYWLVRDNKTSSK